MNASAQSESEYRQPILFFDGVCGLCNRFVDFMLRVDSKDRFRYSPLQGETARRMLWMDGEVRGDEAGSRQTGGETGDHQADAHDPDVHEPGDLRSFIFLDKDRRFEQSSAVLHALKRLGGAWRLIAVLYVFPRPLRDYVYRIVARNRYRWFGRREECRLPTPEERDRFLP
ncbi:MAG: DCC1-like thiol-disulfide oxidoreductase family protein [Gemmatimonadota bacterium]|nr:DCC1-like thiol-disulfide oxidoreductase family protein [Gemmatimonadota bacterium]